MRQFGSWALLIGWTLFLAVLIRWPLSVNWDAMPLDPNSPLHILALEQIASGGNWGEISNLAFPTPVPIRMVAIPTLLLGMPMAHLMGPMAALNVATTLMVALQGLALAGLVGFLRWGKTAQFIAATAAICCPYTIHVQSLGQQENLGLLAMALAVLGALSEGKKGWLVSSLALGIAGFSSPYQAVPTGLILLGTSWTQGRKVVIRSAVCSAIVALPVLLYYTGATDGPSSIPGITTSPPEEGYLASAGILDMVHPRAMWDGRPVELANAWQRLSTFSQPIPEITFHPGWPWITAHQSAYLGLVILLGGIGLYAGRKSPLHRGLLVGAGAALVFAMGPSLRLVSETSTIVPLPWAALTPIPGLSDLQATHRFLSGLVFALILGLAFWLREASRLKAALIAVLLLSEGLLRSPVHWPLPSIRGDLDEVAAELAEGPVMLWPPLTHFAPQYYEMMAVLLDRPVGIYTPSGVTLRGEIRYQGNRQGHLRMDIVRKTGNKNEPFEVVHATTLEGLGAYEVDVEVAIGKIDLIVFIDQEGNGPDPYEPIARIEGVRVSLQDVYNLDFDLIDPAITQDEVERNRAEPIRPGTQLPKDLPQKEGNLSASSWLLRGAQGGAGAIVRTISPQGSADALEDFGFQIPPQSLQIGNEECITTHHWLMPQTLPGHGPRAPRR